MQRNALERGKRLRNKSLYIQLFLLFLDKGEFGFDRGILRQKHGTAIFIRKHRRFIRPDLLCADNDLFFIESDQRTQYGQRDNRIRRSDPFHGLRCDLPEALARDQALARGARRYGT